MFYLKKGSNIFPYSIQQGLQNKRPINEDNLTVSHHGQ